MWFAFALATALSWGCADLFYKKGSDADDGQSHLKIVIMVGLAMGLHAVAYMLVNRLTFNPLQMVRYLPVSAMYILSMALGYVGLRYIELSIASPVQNSSGAISALLLFIVFRRALGVAEIAGIALVTVGVVGVAALEKKGALESPGDKRYRLGALAICFPLLYALIDGLGTFADGIYLDEMELMSENDALLAYEFTFLLCAVICWLYLKFVKKQTFRLRDQRDRALAAILETAGQYFYVFAMSERAIVAAPLVATYSVFSVLLSRVFLKERINRAQYAFVALVLIGVALMGLAEGMAE